MITHGPPGAIRWVIAEGYIPGESHGPEPQMTSHETACILNASDADAHVRVTLYFYCPGRFDAPSVFGRLLGADSGPLVAGT